MRRKNGGNINGKSAVLNEFFTSIFTGSQAFHIFQVPEPPGGAWGIKVLTIGSEEQV